DPPRAAPVPASARTTAPHPRTAATRRPRAPTTSRKGDRHGHRGPHPDHPPHLHRRRQGRPGQRGHARRVFADLDSRHVGIQERIVDGGKLRRFVNVYLKRTRTSASSTASAPKLSDGDSVTILPAVAGGAR
ncbi:LOW QUALITY PROTEIN: thiamine S protein, partial [Streptomyces sp. SPB78]